MLMGTARTKIRMIPGHTFPFTFCKKERILEDRSVYRYILPIGERRGHLLPHAEAGIGKARA